MSIRTAKNRLTGKPTNRIEVVLGKRPDGFPGITVHPNGYGYFCVHSVAVVDQLIEDLKVARAHLAAL